MSFKMNGLIEIIRSCKTYHDAYGEINISPSDLEMAYTNFKKRPQMKVPIKHGSHEVNAPAAGWVDDFEIITNKDGSQSIIATVEWNEDAAEDIRDNRYKYISPEYHKNFIDKETGQRQGFTILGAALLNDPQLDMMREAVALSQEKNGVLTYNLGEINMELTPILEKLGLNPDATLEDVINAIDAMGAKVNESDAMIEEMKTEMSQQAEEVQKLSQASEQSDAQVVKLTQDLVESSKKLEDTTAELESLKVELSQKESREWVRSLSQGESPKITPAQEQVFFELHQADKEQAVKVAECLQPLDLQLDQTSGVGGTGQNDPDQIKLNQVQKLKDSGMPAAEAYAQVAKGN